jgi:hypothetical protein
MIYLINIRCKKIPRIEVLPEKYLKEMIKKQINPIKRRFYLLTSATNGHIGSMAALPFGKNICVFSRRGSR